MKIQTLPYSLYLHWHSSMHEKLIRHSLPAIHAVKTSWQWREVRKHTVIEIKHKVIDIKDRYKISITRYRNEINQNSNLYKYEIKQITYKLLFYSAQHTFYHKKILSSYQPLWFHDTTNQN